MNPGTRPGADDRVAVRPRPPILHPVALAAIALLILNDHILKGAWPGFVTGKLSDLAGLVFFPLLLVGVGQVVLGAGASRRAPGRRAVWLAVAATGIVFALAKVVPLAADAYRIGLGALQWPVAAVGAIAGGVAVPPVSPVVFARDPTDLVALPALLIPLAIAGALSSTLRPTLARDARRSGASGRGVRVSGARDYTCERARRCRDEALDELDAAGVVEPAVRAGARGPRPAPTPRHAQHA